PRRQQGQQRRGGAEQPRQLQRKQQQQAEPVGQSVRLEPDAVRQRLRQPVDPPEPGQQAAGQGQDHRWSGQRQRAGSRPEQGRQRRGGAEQRRQLQRQQQQQAEPVRRPVRIRRRRPVHL